MERNSASSYCSWLTRVRFSRAVCHRTDGIVTPLVSQTELPLFLVPKTAGSDDSSLSGACSHKSDSLVAEWTDTSEPGDSDLEPYTFSFPLSSHPSFSSLSSVDSKGRNSAVSSDCYLSSRDEDYLPMTSSPHRFGCFSRSSISSQSNYVSGRCSSEDCRAFDVKRVPSWSDIFRHSGDEHAVSSIEKWMIDLSQLFLGERFACGKYSRVYYGTYKGETVAVKVMRQPDEDEFMSDRLERLFTQEITLQSGLNHRNIVKFVGACKKPPALCMLMEHLPGGSLRAFLHKAAEPLPLKKVLGMALDIASGMEYLHTCGLVHRDLKSENLLLTDDLRVKIADFGVACYESKCHLMRDDPGTYRWMAPEMIYKKPCSRKVDVFSFGMILYELVSRYVPFEEISAVQAAFAIVHKNARPAIPPDCPLFLEQLMQRCWSSDPNRRPEFWEILKSLQDFEDALEG